MLVQVTNYKESKEELWKNADMLVITKAETTCKNAKIQRKNTKRSLHLFPTMENGWTQKFLFVLRRKYWNFRNMENY